MKNIKWLFFDIGYTLVNKDDVHKQRIADTVKALHDTGCNAESAVMIGDRLDNDIFPAKKAGMKTIWIKQGLGAVQQPLSEEYEADYTVNDLDEILNLLNCK